jgi:hypothetical protein
MIFGARLLKSLLVIAKSMKCLRAIGHTNYVGDVYSRAITVSICIEYLPGMSRAAVCCFNSSEISKSLLIFGKVGFSSVGQ